MPIVPIAAEYVHHGSLKYEFGDELLQSPLQLIKVNNIQAQVLSQLLINFIIKLLMGIRCSAYTTTQTV